MQVNPELLGGLVVDFGDKTIDLSASSKVNKLNALLTRTFSHALGRRSSQCEVTAELIIFLLVLATRRVRVRWSCESNQGNGKYDVVVETGNTGGIRRDSSGPGYISLSIWHNLPLSIESYEAQ